MVVTTNSGASKGGAARSETSDRRQSVEIPGLPARKAASRLLAAVVDAHTPLDGLTDNEHGHPQYLALDGRDRALVRAILATALRFRMTIEALLKRRLERPLPQNAATLSHILHVAAAQILFLDVPDSAAVDLAVEHAKSDPRTARFAGLVNGVLRALVRVKDRALPAALAQTVDAPDWFRQRLEAAYGAERAAAILAMHRIEAPTDFTVKTDPAQWAETLSGLALPTGGVRVARLNGAVADLPGYADGDWWVQDAAAALPARLMGDISGRRVADLCAAPGGKTAQLILAGAQVCALDQSASRIKRLKSNLERLQLDAAVIQADAGKWVPHSLLDAVLLDAPCSSTGTVRRHPDVPWTKSVEDVRKLAGVQKRLLAHAATLVRPGGTIVFSNCSLDPIEGEEMVAGLLAERDDLVVDPVRPDEFDGLGSLVTPDGFVRTTPADLDLGEPGLSGMDGFFAARLKVQSR